MVKKNSVKKGKYSKIKRLKEWVRSHKLLVISVAVAVGFIFAAFGTKIALYLNFILGNDVIIGLDVDKRDIYLLHNQEEQITFEAKVTTNPFCTALCKSSFIGISKDRIIEQDEFTLRPTTPLQKEYLIKPSQIGTGLELYRFDMECHSLKSLLCHTKEEPSTRSILITLQYDLTGEEEILKENLEEQLKDLTAQLAVLKGAQAVFEEAYNELNNTLIFNDKTIDTKKGIELIQKELQGLQEIWKKQDYYFLAEEVNEVKNEFQKTEKNFAEINNSLSVTVFLYNIIINNLNSTRKDLDELQGLFLVNNTRALEINNTINEFNGILNLVQQKTTPEEKENLQKNITEKTGMLVTSTKEEIRREALQRGLDTSLAYDSLCEINSICIQHPSTEEFANKSEFNLNATCKNIDELGYLFAGINESIKEFFLNQSYPDSEEFWNNISSKIGNIKQSVIKKYLEQLPENKSNTELIRELLTEVPFIETEDYTEYNLTPALVVELVSQQPIGCSIVNITINPVGEININKIKINKIMPVPPDIVFEEPVPQCCVFGKCEDCCITEECRNEPSTFPVVFLHGHAINKDVSAEYSLEGFNKIQQRLEEDGYLNAGTITLYTEREATEGVWGLPQIPLTIRASYYFDVFKEPENYVVVQTKSENIDTYAVRLKELIDVIKYKTGKPKVNIIAFSMGGLVARRYVQIFGSESVDKLILIGTPNKGIVGSIADYCPITGEKLECKDMNSESLFINKLNTGLLPQIPIYNIVGAGCGMKGGNGDGIVLEEKALLQGAHNFIINGTCRSKVRPLHLTLRDISLYPEVYAIIRNSLKEDIQEQKIR